MPCNEAMPLPEAAVKALKAEKEKKARAKKADKGMPSWKLPEEGRCEEGREARCYEVQGQEGSRREAD